MEVEQLLDYILLLLYRNFEIRFVLIFVFVFLFLFFGFFFGVWLVDWLVGLLVCLADWFGLFLILKSHLIPLKSYLG